VSNNALTWAFAQKSPTPGEKLVLIALADFANTENNLAWPKQTTLMAMTNLSETSVRKHLAGLVAKGLITRRHRNINYTKRLSDVYELPVEVTVGQSKGTPSHPAGVQATPSESTGPHPRNPTVHTLGTRRIEPSVEPLLEPSVTTTSTAVDGGQLRTEHFERFWNHCRAKVDRKMCETAFAAAVNRRVDPQLIVDRWAAYVEVTKNRDVSKVKRPLTWLRGENWNDDIDAERRTNPGNAAGNVGAVDLKLEDKPWSELMHF
jgi:hypothetical protein